MKYYAQRDRTIYEAQLAPGRAVSGPCAAALKLYKVSATMNLFLVANRNPLPVLLWEDTTTFGKKGKGTHGIKLEVVYSLISDHGALCKRKSNQVQCGSEEDEFL